MAEEHSSIGKVFLITGAASGLGAGFAERFLQEGAKHVAIFDIAEEAGLETAQRLRSQFGADKVSFDRVDVTDECLLTRAFRDLVERAGRVDVVVNNAGMLNDNPNFYRLANEINWQALTTLSLLAWEHMRADKGGKGGTIANISSMAALVQWPWLPVYSGSKSAVLHFSCCLGMEPNHSRSGVRVLCMCFGPTFTPLMQGIRDKCLDEVMGKTFDELEDAGGRKYQSVEDAVEGMSAMFRKGRSASVWLAARGIPVKDITTNVQQAFDKIAEALAVTSS